MAIITPQRSLVFGFILFAGAACAADAIRPLDVRPGMWESTMTVHTSGMPMIPPEVLAKMTPEQKEMMESRMKARSGQSSKPTVTKRCITKEDLAKGFNLSESKGNCTHTVSASSGARQEVRIQCEKSGLKTSGTVRIEAVDPEHVKVTSHFTSGAGPRAMTVDADGSGKWIAAGCANEPSK